MNNKHVKVLAVTFTVFLAEAVIHYNIGARKDPSIKKFILPPTKDFLKIAAVVLVASFVSTEIIEKVGA